MRLLITTLGRAHNQVTLGNLPDFVLPHTHLIVQHHELALHERIHRHRVAGIHGLPPDIDNLGATRQYLVDNFWGEKIVLLDDDLSFYVRSSRWDWHLTTPSQQQWADMLWEVEARLDDYAHVGVSGREGNNRESRYGAECTRYMRFLAYNLRLWPQPGQPGYPVRCDRVNGMSDFDINLQLLRSGRPSYVFYRYAQGQAGTQTPGGCSLNRTHETHSAEVDLMCAMHAGLVQKRTKTNKSGGDFGARDEVTIFWKRALDYDERRADGRDAGAESSEADGGSEAGGEPDEGCGENSPSDEQLVEVRRLEAD